VVGQPRRCGDGRIDGAGSDGQCDILRSYLAPATLWMGLFTGMAIVLWLNGLGAYLRANASLVPLETTKGKKRTLIHQARGWPTTYPIKGSIIRSDR
jgi:hypothetical protein